MRLVCPECELVYRTARLVPGKNYVCKKCGGGLRCMEPADMVCPVCGDTARVDNLDLGNPPHCASCSDSPALVPPGPPAGSAADGSDAGRGVLSPSRAVVPSQPSVPVPMTTELESLPGLIGDLAGRLEEFRRLRAADDGAGDANRREGDVDAAGALSEALERLSERLVELERHLVDGFAGLGGQLSGLSEKVSGEGLAESVRQTGELFLARLEECREAQKRELAELLAARPEEAEDGRTVELDVDALAERLASGFRVNHGRLDAESGSAVDALARVADGLVREQSANTSRLDALTEEIKQAVADIAKLEQWRGELPELVTDEIGRTVEDRVVGPISAALARQAPAILSELQDNKLLDIVSRSVREAQRPLLREILSGGRGGVPVWLFASILLPLLLILGYLFLPGELGFGEREAKVNAIAGSLERLENEGVPVSLDVEERLDEIGKAVGDIRNRALAEMKTAGALEEENRNLNAELQKNALTIKEWEEVLKAQTTRIRALEARLIRLGVSPDTVEN